MEETRAKVVTRDFFVSAGNLKNTGASSWKFGLNVLKTWNGNIYFTNKPLWFT